VVLTKADLLAPGEDPPALDAPEADGVYTVSSVARTGLTDLLEALWVAVREAAAGVGGEDPREGDEGWETPWEEDEDWENP
jgi:hypothetical protein